MWSFSTDFSSLLVIPVVILVTIIVGYFIWLLFFKPFNLVRDFTDFGFENISKHGNFKNNAVKRHTINEYMKRRRIGNIPPSYPNGWFAILESEEIVKNAVKEVDVLGLNLVAWRGESGRCYVADAYCPHLGAHLGVDGKVKKECIECPFHGWKFEGCSGKLTSIPNIETVPPAKLKMWPVNESNGFVHIWYHAENESPSWYPPVAPEVESGAWKYRGRSEFRVACHIQEIPENAPDSAHLNFVHDPPVTAGIYPEKARLKWSFLKHEFSSVWAPNTNPDDEHESIMSVCHHLVIFDKFPSCQMKINIRQIGPGIVNMYLDTPVGRGFLVLNTTPVEPMMQRVVQRLYSSPTFIHPLCLLLLYSEAVQFARDTRIWNRKLFLRNALFTKEDHQIKTFRRWFSQFYSKNSPKFQPGLKSNKDDF